LGLYTVRVRGIYATALSVLYHSRGFLIADASEVLRERLAASGVVAVNAPPTVTVKSLEDSPDEVLIIGYPWEAGVEAERALLEGVGYASVRRGRLGLYTVVDAISLGGCRLRLPGGLEGKLDSGECPPEGEAVRATVAREALEPGSEPLLKPGVRVVGEYIMLQLPGSGFSFSEHIPPERRVDLVTATAGIDSKIYHIHFRSASRTAPLENVRSEAARLAEEAEALLSERPSGEPRVVRRGEYISIVYLPRPAKEELDKLRAQIYPTITLHHTLKAGGRIESLLVDYAEEALKAGACRVEAGAAAEAFIAKSLRGRRIHVDHRRPDGSRLRLGPFTVAGVADSRRGVALTLERRFTRPGILDGLNVEKRPGDRATTRISTSEWHIIHEYWSQEGRLLGVYANVNTPPEISLAGIRYLDLYVDVVMRPGEDPRVIDMEELDKAYKEGIVTEILYKRAIDEAEKLAKALPGMYE
jgi:Ribonuclease G/E